MPSVNKKALIVEARFYDEIADGLYEAAAGVLIDEGYQITRINVPGALEIPAAISVAGKSGEFDAYVGLGCVIRGQTTHYDHVAEESFRGLQDLAVHYQMAIGNGIMTVENREQAEARIERNGKGAAHAAIAVDRLRDQFGLNDN